MVGYCFAIPNIWLAKGVSRWLFTNHRRRGKKAYIHEKKRSFYRSLWLAHAWTGSCVMSSVKFFVGSCCFYATTSVAPADNLPRINCGLWCKMYGHAWLLGARSTVEDELTAGVMKTIHHRICWRMIHPCPFKGPTGSLHLKRFICINDFVSTYFFSFYGLVASSSSSPSSST